MKSRLVGRIALRIEALGLSGWIPVLEWSPRTLGALSEGAQLWRGDLSTAFVTIPLRRHFFGASTCNTQTHKHLNTAPILHTANVTPYLALFNS